MIKMVVQKQSKKNKRTNMEDGYEIIYRADDDDKENDAYLSATRQEKANAIS